MDKQELQVALTKLHQQLSTVENVDESTKEMLSTVMEDIDKLLASDQPEEQKKRTTGSDSVRELVTEFEAEHPKLAQALGQLADGLANLGI